MESAVAAAEAGKHVVVEKPLEVTLEEMLVVCKAVRRGTARALVSCDLPYGPAQESPQVESPDDDDLVPFRFDEDASADSRIEDDFELAPDIVADEEDFDEEFDHLENLHRVVEIQELLGPREKVGILLQPDPDPDGIASGIALRAILNRKSTTAPLISFGEVKRPENLEKMMLPLSG